MLAVRPKAIVGKSGSARTTLVMRPNNGLVTRNAGSTPVIFASRRPGNRHGPKS